MRNLTALTLLAAAILAACIGSASACSYGNTDVAVDGKGNVVELVDDGLGNQITGRVFGNYNRLRANLWGDCSVLVVEQRGRGTDVSVYTDGWDHHLGVLASRGAKVDVKTAGHDSTVLAEVAGGDVRIRNVGANQIYVRRK